MNAKSFALGREAKHYSDIARTFRMAIDEVSHVNYQVEVVARYRGLNFRQRGTPALPGPEEGCTKQSAVLK
jgi:hypothetical protein